MKIVTIIGARPQFIKAAVVSRLINSSNDIEEIIVHTGQHFDENMSNVFFTEMSIPKPNYNLNINGLGHGAMTGQMLEGIENILLIEKPEWVLVYGDTNSTLAGAIAAKKLQIRLAHVEAGLRSYNMAMPEEINRILTDRISDLLFCPTKNAVVNLESEGFSKMDLRIIKNGDVMQDAAIFYSEKAKKPDVDLPDNFVLCTIHRAENTDNIERFKSIFRALEEISSKIKIILPLHPRTKSKLDTLQYDIYKSNICFISPVSYLEMVYLLKTCKLVLTDSGGLQKEAYFFKKKCLTLRDETEWTELIDNGFNVLAGSKYDKIISSFDEMLKKDHLDFSKNLYGEGNAGEIIIDELRLV